MSSYPIGVSIKDETDRDELEKKDVTIELTIIVKQKWKNFFQNFHAYRRRIS